MQSYFFFSFSSFSSGATRRTLGRPFLLWGSRASAFELGIGRVEGVFWFEDAGIDWHVLVRRVVGLVREHVGQVCGSGIVQVVGP